MLLAQTSPLSLGPVLEPIQACHLLCGRTLVTLRLTLLCLLLPEAPTLTLPNLWHH